jgi:hypothetical protein
MDDRELVTSIRRRYERLREDRRGWDSYWRDVKDYMSPGRGRLLDTSSDDEVNSGRRRDAKRIDCEAGRALDVLASGIQSGLTSKARQWFLLQHPDPAVSGDHDVRVWYNQVQEILEGIFVRSNVYAALRSTYYEMAAFGQGVMSVEFHPDNLISCRCHTCGTYCLDTNPYQEVDTVFSIEWMTASQLLEKFGAEACGQDIAEEAGPGRAATRRYEVVNLVTEAPWRYGLQATDRHPVASVHFLGQKSGGGCADRLLRVSGYGEFPYMCPRWEVVDNDVYGWAPTRDIMGDVKMLQTMQSDKLKGLAKIVSPPMRIPPEMERRGLNMRPGATNVVSSLGDQAIAPLYTVGMDIQQVGAEIQSIRQNIKDGLYNSLFLALLMQDTPQMTATEVQVRNQEKMLMLGPVLERIHYELLDPLITRVFALAMRNGMIPEPPAALLESEAGARIEYVSILSQAQKAVGVSRLEQSVQFLGGIVQVAPETRHLVNWYKLYKSYNEMIGVREDVFRSDREYEEAVQAEAARQQAAAAAQSAEPLANSAKALSDVDVTRVQDAMSQFLGGGSL